MDSKFKELSAEEMELVSGGLVQPRTYTVDQVNGKLIPNIENQQTNLQPKS